jgi:prepilin-type N-terminal cleavage/methylation domain-containing protein
VRSGFTLVEMLVAMAIVSILVFMLAQAIGHVSKIWVNSRGKITALQNGRAILDFMARDLRRVAVPHVVYAAPTMHPDGNPGAWKAGETPTGKVTSFPATPLSAIQFVQDAGLPGSGIQEWLPEKQTVVPNSSNFFGQLYGRETVHSNVWIFGYYLAEDAHGVRKLYRLAAPPANRDGAPTEYGMGASVRAGQSGSDIPWLARKKMFAECAFPQGDNVVAFYVVCLDHRQRPIPWLGASNSALAPLKFDSAAAFVMGTGTGSAFTYLQAPSSNIPALPAHRLPASLRISILTMDKTAAKRGIILPAPPALEYAPDRDFDLEAIRQYQLKLAGELHLPGVQLFTLNIHLNQGAL